MAFREKSLEYRHGALRYNFNRALKIETRNTNLQNVLKVSCCEPFHFGGVIRIFTNNSITVGRDVSRSSFESFTSKLVRKRMRDIPMLKTRNQAVASRKCVK